MEFFILFVIIVLFIWLHNSFSGSIKNLTYEVRFLREFIQRIEKERKENVSPGTLTSETKPEKETPKVPVEKIIPVAEKIPPPEPQKKDLWFIKEEFVEPKAPLAEDVKEKQVFENVKPFDSAQGPPFDSAQGPPLDYAQGKHEPVVPKQTFLERYPDLERFIGENLINKIGIAILVLGIAYFVKYAIDKDWINEIGRVGIGVLAGGILIGIAHRMHKTFKAFSSVLVGGGLAVLYFTIAIGFHQYHIFNQTTAFIIMVVITSFAVALSLAYDRIELAVLAILGGFASPFIVSTGEGNYIVLFTYLLILDCGMLVLAYRKKWNLVNILCYVCTILIYGSWLLTKCLDVPSAPYMGAYLFGTSFYIVFFLMNIVYNIRNKIAFQSLEIGLLLSNTFLYYSAGMGIFHFYLHNEFQGLFTALLGVFNFGFAFVFYKNKNIDRNLIFLLIGLVLTFISLTAPIQLEGNHITLFWSAEAVLLLWFSQKSKIKLIETTAIIVNVLMFISLLLDWIKYYVNDSPDVLPLFLNKAFITGCVSLVSVLLTIRLLKDETDDDIQSGKLTLGFYKSILKIVFVVILYTIFVFELNYQLIHAGYDYNSRNISLGIYNFSFLTILYFFSRKKTSHVFPVVFVALSGISMLSYLLVYNKAIINVRDMFLMENTSSFFFMLHFVFTALVAMIIYIFYDSSKKILSLKDMVWIKWITVFLIVFLCSAELNHIVTWLSYSPGRIIYAINRQVDKAGYTVLWGIISLVLMQQGMKNKDRALRIISLSLFLITILKLFLSDIRGVSEGGRIAAFISLGVLLLVVSFMYQRLKKLILEAEPKIKIDPDLKD